MARQKKISPPTQDAASYQHPEADLPARPEIGAQAHFKKVRAPATYHFDSSLAPDYNCTVFRVRQAFFPHTGASENLKMSLKVKSEGAVSDHLAGTVSAPFDAGMNRQIAEKVIDPRGNELVVVKKLESKR